MPCNFKVLQALNFWPSKNLQRFPFTAQKNLKVVLDAVTIKGCGVFSFGPKFVLFSEIFQLPKLYQHDFEFLFFDSIE